MLWAKLAWRSLIPTELILFTALTPGLPERGRTEQAQLEDSRLSGTEKNTHLVNFKLRGFVYVFSASLTELVKFKIPSKIKQVSGTDGRFILLHSTCSRSVNSGTEHVTQIFMLNCQKKAWCMAPLKRMIYMHVRQYPGFRLVCCLVCGLHPLVPGSQAGGKAAKWEGRKTGLYLDFWLLSIRFLLGGKL